MKTIKVLISGARSRTCFALLNILLNETDYEIVLLSNKKKDVGDNKRIKFYTTDLTQINTLKKICYEEAPNVIVVTNGLHDINKCEINKKLAWTVNVTIVENFLTIARVLDSHLIIISTDQVFDGRKGPYTEEDKPNPQNYFGKTKHAAENAILVNLLKSTVIRTSMIYGPTFYLNNDFIDEIIAEYNNKEEVIVTEGIYTNPTLVDDLALAILKIINKKRYGIYNVAGVNILNNIEIHKQIIEIFNLNKNKFKIIEQKSKSLSQRANNKFGLVTIKAETDLNIKFTNFQNGLITWRYNKDLLEKYI
ncbi:MAG: sugar nucleotide-binding protein [Candidatus Woesearchaeota archaeon]